MSAWKANQSHDKNCLHHLQQCVSVLRMVNPWVESFKAGLR